MERVTPSAMNYDNILPLAIESRSNRREFVPTNGAVFSNATGATHIRIDVNADSMLDALNSYLSVDITNNSAVGNTFLGLAPFTPAFIQRLRIESGGVVIEDIDEYSRLYAMTSLCQCPEDYLKNNYANMGLYQAPSSCETNGADNNNIDKRMTAPGFIGPNAGNDQTNGHGMVSHAGIMYPPSLQATLAGCSDAAPIANNAANTPTASGVLNHWKIPVNGVQTLCFPLMSGFLNMDKYIPLIMMNAGFTIDIEICSVEKIGCATVEAAAGNSALGACLWTVGNVKYVAHLIDLDRSFYDKLRAVMESTEGVLQLAGQTYRHYVGQIPVGVGPHTITLPARVKSVKSIFATFHDSTNYGTAAGGYSTSVFQNAQLNSFRFEIGSVRYPVRDINCKVVGGDVGNTAGVVDQPVECATEYLVELQKAFGKLGDYSHQNAFNKRGQLNVDVPMTGGSTGTSVDCAISSFVLGYDFEAFQRVALEAGINTADRSLPINFICDRWRAIPANETRADFYVLTDAIYYISVDGTVSVSV